MTRLLLAALLLLPAARARAAYEDLGAGARAAGMGNAFVPVADDVYALYFNPAGLGALQRPELGASYSLLYSGLTDNSNLGSSFVGYAQPLSEGRRGTLGAAWNSFSLNGNLYREDALSLSYGRLAYRTGGEGSLYAGASLKYLRSSFGSFPEAANGVPANGLVGTPGLTDPRLSGARVRSVFDGDAGLLYRAGPHYAAGLTAVHLSRPNVSFGAGDADRLPLILKAGFDYRSLISNLVLEYDTQQTPAFGRDNTVTFGAERWFPQAFAGDVAARAALSLGSRERKEADAGVSYRTKRLQVDYALGLPLGGAVVTVSAHKVSLTFRFGKRTEEEESLAMVLEAMKRLKAGQTVEAPPSSGPGSDRAAFDERLALSRGYEARARYFDALQELGQALQAAPADQALVKRYQRLSLFANQIKALPEFKTDPVQATLHLGLTAYARGDDLEAVQKSANALSLKPDWKELDALLTEMEAATGLKRALFPARTGAEDEAALFLAQARAALEDGDNERARDLSRRVIALQADNAGAWENLGTADFALKDYNGSLAAWVKAEEHERNPAVRAAIRAMIRRIRRAGADETAPAPAPAPAAAPAAPAMTQAEELDLFNRAVDHYTRGETPQAIQLLEKILASDPGSVEAAKALRRMKEDQP